MLCLSAPVPYMSQNLGEVLQECFLLVGRSVGTAGVVSINEEWEGLPCSLLGTALKIC